MILLFAGINSTGAIAQEEYRSLTGLLVITANVGDIPVTISSKELHILLDYETGKIVMKQEISALISDNDSIQSKLNSIEKEYFEFEGKLNLDYINTTGHPPLDFTVEGIIQPSGHNIIGTGRLEHLVEGTMYACILSLTFKLDFEEAFPAYQLEGLNKVVYVKVIQSLMARVNE